METIGLPPAHQSVRTVLSDASGVGEVRRIAVSMAGYLGFDETQTGKLALVVTEAGTNIVRHAGSGELLLRALKQGDARGLEVLALDKGPGMRNIEQCLVDGYSTGGSSGTGLGGMRRMADVFDIFSTDGGGTALVAELWQSAAAVPIVRPAWSGAVCVALEGEEQCGDAFALSHQADGHAKVLMIDGLGHGQGAADAARAALDSFALNAAAAPTEIVERLHAALRSTRGAALEVVDLSWAAGELRFIGVGNCCGLILGGAQSQSLASYNGIVGAKLPRLHEFSYPWPKDGLLILHTDGMTARWSLDAYPGLARRHPSLIAAVLYRDFARHRDDVTVLALKAAGSYAPIW